jgi:hypothetical protein
MSDRIVKHSSRYKGPAGDSRPAAEIFAGIAARDQESKHFTEALIAAFDTVWRSATLHSPEARIELIWETTLDWRMMHDIEFAERVNAAYKGDEEGAKE